MGKWLCYIAGMNQTYDHFGDTLAALVKAWRALLDERLRPFGLSQARWQVLLKLLRASQPLTQCDLASRIGIEPASLVRLLDVLQKEDLIVREADPLDRRSKRVSLTANGRALSEKLAVVAESLRGEVLGVVATDELARCTAVLEQLCRQIEPQMQGEEHVVDR
jgi:MarR family transcriptional regulator for hemolysin